jgi:uncharacterized protein YndB with AHSA1/START domain
VTVADHLLPDTIVEEVTYAHPIDKVWRALTERELLDRWLMATDFEPRIGHRFTFTTDPAPGFSGRIECVVDELDPPNRLGFTWWGGGGNPRTHVRMTLRATTASETTLRLEHDGFASRGLRGAVIRQFMKSGWRTRLLRQQLPALLDELDPRGVP